VQAVQAQKQPFRKPKMYPSILGKDAFAENRHSEPEKFRIAEKKNQKGICILF